MKIIILLCILIISKSVYADCFTGFACSIEDIERKEQAKLQADIEIYKEYLKKQKQDVMIFQKDKYSIKYKDLFIFKPFV